jgi:hypothetical protein
MREPEKRALSEFFILMWSAAGFPLVCDLRYFPRISERLRNHLKSLIVPSKEADERSQGWARKKRVADQPLATIWRVDHVFWAEIEGVLEEHGPPACFGPARIDQRKALDGVIYRMRSGVQ